MVLFATEDPADGDRPDADRPGRPGPADDPGLIRRIGNGGDARSVSSAFQSDRHPEIAVLFRRATTGHDGTPLPVFGVEVVSRGKRARRPNYDEKRDYLAIGLREDWIVAPEERRVTVLARREAGGTATWEERNCWGDDVIAGELLPGFAGAAAQLWHDLDEGP